MSVDNPKIQIIQQPFVSGNFPQAFIPSQEWYSQFILELNRTLNVIQTNFYNNLNNFANAATTPKNSVVGDEVYYVSATSGGPANVPISFNNGRRVANGYVQPNTVPSNPFQSPPIANTGGFSGASRVPKQIP